MKKSIICIVSFFVLCLTNLAQAEQSFDLDFVYCQNGCSGRATPVSAYNDGQVLPYASLKLTFDRPLTNAEKAEFVSHFRLTNGAGEQVPHLHEKISDLPVSGQQSSFTWLDTRFTLTYTASSLPAGETYTIAVPSGWSENKGITSFSTLPLTGDGIRAYEVFCPDLECYEKLTDDVIHGTLDQSYADVVFEDAYANKTYQDTEMRIRGSASTWIDKKSYTVKFDSDELFEDFKDSSGIYQGPRKKLVFIAHKVFETSNLSANKLMNDVARKLEKRIFGAAVAADSYFSLLVFNGRFWGVYNVSEHISTGKGGWSTMKDRTEILDFDDKGKGMLHKAIFAGFGRVSFGDGYGIEPKTDHEYEFSTRGDGVQRHWAETIPFNVFYEVGDFDFEIAAKKPKMKLKPNIEQSLPSTSFVLSGDGTGSLDISDTEAHVVVDFEQAVDDGKKIEAEFKTVFDFQAYYDHIQDNRNYAAVEDWFHVDSSLISMFVIRASASWDHGEHNRYMFSREKSLEDFRDASQAPDEHRYYDVLWDGDLAFAGDCVANFITDECTRRSPLHWKIIVQSPEGRQRYIDLFAQEKQAGGVLTPEYYQQQIREHLAMLGNAQELEELRWNRSLDYDGLLSYTDNRFGDSDFVENTVLRLHFEPDIPPPANDRQWKLSSPSQDHENVYAADATAIPVLVNEYPICRSTSPYQTVGFVKEDKCYVRSYYNRGLYIKSVGNYEKLWVTNPETSVAWVSHQPDHPIPANAVSATDENQIRQHIFYICRATNRWKTMGFLKNGKCRVMGYRDDNEYWENNYELLTFDH